ncbi:MAG: DUF58 domain-containing protein [Phycisphaeraceae bacterium]|nr:DUF58 domain-containing protein [Phycisphaeraceae bacterium]
MDSRLRGNDEKTNITMEQAQVTQLLANDMLHRLERLRINASGRFTNRMRGEHLAAKGGSSMEFADYRDYVEGDDTRFIDWNIFSRLRKPYIKLFHHEEQMQIVILVDASSSMMVDGKLERAQQLAAAMCVCGLFAAEPVSVYTFNQPTNNLSMVGPATGRGSLHKLLKFVENIESGEGGSQPPDDAVDTMLKRHRGKGIVVMLSDFLTYGDLKRTFNTLNNAGLEIFACQILGERELDPDLTSDLRLVDCENADILDVTAQDNLLDLYHEYLSNFQNTIAALARQRGGKFLCVNSDEDLSAVLFDQMRREAWLV